MVINEAWTHVYVVKLLRKEKMKVFIYVLRGLFLPRRSSVISSCVSDSSQRRLRSQTSNKHLAESIDPPTSEATESTIRTITEN